MWTFNKVDKDKFGPKITEKPAKDSFTTYKSMLREGVQNSIDAKSPNQGKVTIRIDLETIDTKELENFIFPDNDSEEHFIQSKIKNPNAKVNIFKFEDFNTTGLKGDINDDEGEENGNYAFWMQEGITSNEKKNGESGGSRGIGKISFAYASKYSTFFASSMHNKKLETRGYALLEPKRKVNDESFYKDAYFTEQANSKKELNKKQQEEFNKVFKLNRTENGLSIVILDPNYEELINPLYNEEKLTEKDFNQDKTITSFARETCWSLVQEFYFLFMEDKLEVNIHRNNKLKEEINKDNIIDLMNNDPDYFSTDYIEFIRSMYSNKSYSFDLMPIDKDSSPNNLLENIPEDKLKNIRNKFENNEIISLSIPYEFYIDDAPKTEKLVFFLQKSKNGEGHFRRHILDINSESKKAVKELNNIANIGLYIDTKQHPYIQKELKEKEDDAHQKWYRNNWTFRELKNIDVTITKTIPELFKKILSETAENEEIFLSAFDDIFNIKQPEIDKKDTKKEDHVDGEIETDDNIDIETTPSGIKSNKVKGGFNISLEKDFSFQELSIEVAYKLDNKSPSGSLKDFDKYDFDLEKEITFKKSSCQDFTIEENKITIHSPSKEFSIKATGFDVKRDLVLRVEGK